MATSMTVTVGSAFAYSGGKSCKSIYDLLDQEYPNWTEDTQLDVYTWTEQQRSADQAANANYGIYRGLSTAQQRQFVNWALGKIIDYTPDNYARKNAMINLKDDLASYISSPTTQKKNALLATAKAIKPTTNSHAEMYVANAFKGITVAVANNVVTGDIINNLAVDLSRAASLLGNITIKEANEAILTKLQQIIGVRD